MPSFVELERARAGRAFRAKEVVTRTEWFIERITNVIKLGIEDRLKVATLFLREKVVENISKSVTRSISSEGRVFITARSLPGEYPRAETTRLMRTMLSDVQEVSPGIFEGYVGTPLEYGLFLETDEQIDRGFLRRTLEEETFNISEILLEPFTPSFTG